MADSLSKFFFHLDLLTVLTAYVFLAFGSIAAGAFAVSQGICMEVFCHARPGLFTLVYLAVVGGVGVFKRFFELENPTGQLIICASVELLAHAVRDTMVLLVSPAYTPPAQSFLNSALISATITGLAGPVFFLLLDRANTILNGDSPSPRNAEFR